MAPAMPTAIHRQVAARQAGAFPRLIARMESGWAILGEPQIVLGYGLLLPDCRTSMPWTRCIVSVSSPI